MGAKLTGAKPVIMSLGVVMKQHQIAVQSAMAAAMTKTRVRAKDYIIDNSTPWVNPYMARKEQPNTPGRLTSRTGKLKFMLGHKADFGHPLRHWKGFGKTLVKERSVALMGQIRTEKLTKRRYAFIGTYRVNIQQHPRLFDTARKRPQESTRTLAVRFNWETGIRGQTRPIFKPVYKEADFDMLRFLKQREALIWRLK